MKTKNLFLFFISTLTLAGCQNTGSKSPERPVIFTLGEESVYVDEFKYVYEKHNSNTEDFYSHKSVHEYLDLYTNFRLKIREAEALKMDTSKAFIDELAGHRKSLAKPYLTEKAVSDKLMKEAYDRLQEEVRASHILILTQPEAEPEDTLKAYNRIKKVKERADAGDDFGVLAVKYSEDRSAEIMKGDLGWFSSFSMVYPFESNAYNTPVGSVSDIFRTKYGYHILKTTDRRKSKGQYRVAHIMIRASQGMDNEDSLTAKNKIDEIYAKLNNGESWEALCNQFSEDGNSKARGGELQLIDVNSRIVNEFKDAAFALEEVGEYTKPVRTPYGWHIVKLLEKVPLQSYEELEPSLKLRIERDSRSELGQKLLLNRLRTENKLVEHEGMLDLAVSKADSSLLSGTFKFPEKDKDFDKILISIMDENYTIRDFYVYLSDLNRVRQVSPEFFVKLGYSDYVDDMLIDYEDRHLEEKHLDFKMLYKEYRDGILMFNLMDDKVWSQSTRDTTGLKSYFDKNRSRYQWETRADAIIYDCESKLIAEKVKTEMHFGKYPVKNPREATFYYDYRKDELTQTDIEKILKLAKRLKTDSTYIVRITATTSKKEAYGKNKDIVDRRLEKLVSALIADGIPADNIMKINAAFRFDREKSDKVKRSVKVDFLSTTDRAFENYINGISPLGLKITRGKFEKGDIEVLDKIDWKPGDYTFVDGERTYYITIKEVLDARPKELKEVKGEVISNYQEYLESEWLHQLRSKYPVVYKEEEVNKLIKE